MNRFLNRCKKMKSFLFFLFITMSLSAFSDVNASSLTTPETQKVYGGRINAIDAVPISSTITRVFISTESANSMFYADVDHSVITPTFGAFQTVPDMDSDDGYGKGISSFSADRNSGYLFSISNGSLLSCSVITGTLSTIVTNTVQSVAIYDSTLFYLAMDANLQLHYGTISSGGIYSESGGIAVGVSGSPMMKIIVNPSNNYVYIFEQGNSPKIYKSSDTYDSLSSGSNFSTMVDVSGLSTSREYTAFGIGSDGRIFAGAKESTEPNQSKFIAYTDNDGTSWTDVLTGINGVPGNNIVTGGSSAPYYVYFGSAVSTNSGESGSWHTLPNGGTYETHSNDGMVFVDPNNSAVMYLTTDHGLGVSIDNGVNIFDIDDGVEAVQVNDFDMNDGKTTGWLASKSGIRQVTDYDTITPTWKTFFPNNDGSPYYSIAMDKSDSTGGTAYAGNTRLYKTTDAGSGWTMLFSTEDSAYSGIFDFSSYVSSIAINPDGPDVVIIGVNSASSGVKGGVLTTEDAGSTNPTWTLVDTGVYNTEVKDLLVVGDSTVTSTIYVGCDYVSDGTTSSYGVKTITYNSSAKTFTFDNDMVSADTATNITNFGAYSLAVNSSGDVYASGTNSSENPRVYIRADGTSTWEMMSTSGLPSEGIATAITIGEDTSSSEVPYIAVGESVYYFNGTSWVLSYDYPKGTDINVLYWDDLLVGTGTGLYAQFTTSLDLPDLKAMNVKVSTKIKRKKTAKIKTSVKNIGDKKSSKSKVSFYLSTNNSTSGVEGDTLLKTKSLGRISKNKGKTVVYKWKPSNKQETGKYYLKVFCDSKSQIDELSEDNNISTSKKITIK